MKKMDFYFGDNNGLKSEFIYLIINLNEGEDTFQCLEEMAHENEVYNNLFYTCYDYLYNKLNYSRNNVIEAMEEMIQEIKKI